MPKIECSIKIKGDQSAIYDLTQNYNLRLLWDPFLKKAELLNGATQAAVGVRAWCVSKNGLGMETEYITLSPPDLTAIKMTRGPKIIKSFAGSWRFRKVADGLTQVIFRYHFNSAPAWLRHFLNPFMIMIFRRDMVKRLNALKLFVENEMNIENSKKHRNTVRL